MSCAASSTCAVLATSSFAPPGSTTSRRAASVLEADGEGGRGRRLQHRLHQTQPASADLAPVVAPRMTPLLHSVGKGLILDPCRQRKLRALQPAALKLSKQSLALLLRIAHTPHGIALHDRWCSGFFHKSRILWL